MHIIVFGCSSGFGKAVARRLLADNHTVSGISRTTPDPETILADSAKAKTFTHYSCDVLNQDALNETLDRILNKHDVSGMVLNAGGPPVGKAAELTPDDCRNASRLVLDWKIQATLKVLPTMRSRKEGTILFIESQSVKQPIPGLALSNIYRAAVTGFAKTLAGEVAIDGITVNVIAPGSHSTPALERVITKRQEEGKLSRDKTIARMTASIPAGRFGKADELAALASWLISGESRFITGQTISHDGGNIQHLFG